MNASAVFLLLATFLVAFAFGLPEADDLRLDGLRLKVSEEVEDSEILTSEDGDGPVRVRRATCDLLSVNTPWGSLNHSACAAHCLAKRKGFKGGRCKDGVCHCRK